MISILSIISIALVAYGVGYVGYWRGRNIEFHIWNKAVANGKIEINDPSFLGAKNVE